jgi:hypothetical protein
MPVAPSVNKKKKIYIYIVVEEICMELTRKVSNLSRNIDTSTLDACYTYLLAWQEIRGPPGPLERHRNVIC